MADIWQIILNQCHLKLQLQILLTSKYLGNRLYILTLDDSKLTRFMNDQILMQNKFREVMILNACNNPNIKNISFLKKLIELKANGNCGIDQDGIRNLNSINL